MQRAFVLVFIFLGGALGATLPTQGQGTHSIRVLLSYQAGATSFEERYLFPSLSLVPQGGSVQIASGPRRENLRPIVTFFPNRPLTFSSKNGRLVVVFEGLVFPLEAVVQLKPAEAKTSLRYRLLWPSGQALEYPGELWLESRGDGLLVVNAVELQTYLKRVLPSEMPAHFHLEALKAQAVAARTYAYTRQQAQSFWKRFGADLDDSTSEQAYNQTRPHPTADAAVDSTLGQILAYRNTPIQSFYFSTSPGATASIEEVWMDRPATPYLKGRPQSHAAPVSIGTEAEALAFFQNWNPQGFFDAESPFWRWKISLSREELEALLSRTLPERAQAAPAFVQSRGGSPLLSEEGFVLGRLQQIRVIRRSPGGYVGELEIQTSSGHYRVQRESHIRQLLRPDRAFTGGKDVVLERWQGEPLLNFPTLPSAAFALEEKRDATSQLLGLTLWGGGLGHGVGMSQYGAQGLARRGWNYRQILRHFYPGSAIASLR